MFRSSTGCAAFLLFAVFVSTVAGAQSPPEEFAPLPTILSTKLQSLVPLSAEATPEAEVPQLHARRPVPQPQLPLSADEASYKLAVQKLGVNEHRFVHCDLANGKVRTGVIIAIRENDFVLKDGIFATHEISYTDLKAAPRLAVAIGTHLRHSVEWTGVVGLCVVLLPFCLLSVGV